MFKFWNIFRVFWHLGGISDCVTKYHKVLSGKKKEWKSNAHNESFLLNNGLGLYLKVFIKELCTYIGLDWFQWKTWCVANVMVITSHRIKRGTTVDSNFHSILKEKRNKNPDRLKNRSSAFWSCGCLDDFSPKTGGNLKINVTVHVASLSLTVCKHLTRITWLLICESCWRGITRKSHL
jgi:hypothetical protein